jgi:HD-like signal output (HDOD) protein
MKISPSNGEQLEPARLRQFQPFAKLDSHQLILLASKAKYLKVEKKVQLFSHGDIDTNEFFLLSGEVEMLSADGVRHVVKSSDQTAKRQLARLRPRQYTVTALSACELVVLDADLIEEIQNAGMHHDSDGDGYGLNSYGVNEVGSLEEFKSKEILISFRQALQDNSFVLPSLPEVAVKVRRLLEDDDCDVNKISAVVNTDPAIAAKLIRAANSPIYHGSSQCDTTQAAIVRLGLQTTRQLVISFAMKDLFSSSSPLHKKKMQGVWQHSVEVAAISLVISRMVKIPGCSPDEAMLAGLLHDIGVIAAIGFLESRQQEIESDEKFEATLELMRADAGEAILKLWRFPEAFITAARESKNWMREHRSSADLCDIVQVAKLHSYIRAGHAKLLPRIDKVPAFAKLPLGEVTPELTFKILDESKAQIQEAKHLLGQ